MNLLPRGARASSSLRLASFLPLPLHRRALTFHTQSTTSFPHRLSLPLQRQRKHPRRTLIAPPRSDQGPLMERRADRALPEIHSPALRWLRTLPIFVAIITLSALAIFNYQKSSSSVVNATLYSLRTSSKAREILGEEIYFRDRFPWVWGELNQLHGRIDIGFGVKGRKTSGYMRFRSFRKGKNGFFQTIEWSLETEDGHITNLLEEEGANDPFRKSGLQIDPNGAKQES